MSRAYSPMPAHERYSKHELRKLLEEARSYVRSHSSYLKQIETKWFCREKNEEYFDNTREEDGNIMKKYNKDNHGDPKNPINDRLDGLFFNPTVDYRTGRPPTMSPYGDKRIKILATKLVQRAPNLYFSDFYCVSRQRDPHYVQLVMTAPGSDADSFCQRELIAISPTDREENPFFFRTTSDDDADDSDDEDEEDGEEAAAAAAAPAGPKCSVICSASRSLWVEVFYTEDVDLNQEIPLSSVTSFGHRSGGSVGLRKNIGCEICCL